MCERERWVGEKNDACVRSCCWRWFGCRLWSVIGRLSRLAARGRARARADGVLGDVDRNVAVDVGMNVTVDVVVGAATPRHPRVIVRRIAKSEAATCHGRQQAWGAPTSAPAAPPDETHGGEESEETPDAVFDSFGVELVKGSYRGTGH